MDLTNIYFPAWFSWATNVIAVVLIAAVIHSLSGSANQLRERLNQWLWSVFFLGIVWFLRAGLESGINMHISGGMIMALMFGWRMGFLGLALLNVMMCLLRDAMFINLGIAVILNALVPVSVSYLIFLLLEAKLPRHFFIYIYGSAFFGTWFMSTITGIVTAFCLAVFGAFEWSVLASEYLAYHFLLGFSEAFLTSGLITLFVVYRPSWVYSFRDQRYLHGK